MSELQEEQDRLMEELNAMDKHFDETGFFTSEDEEMAKELDKGFKEIEHDAKVYELYENGIISYEQYLALSKKNQEKQTL